MLREEGNDFIGLENEIWFRKENKITQNNNL